MKKIVSNGLIVGSQLIVGGLFLVMLFSKENTNDKVIMIENNNLNKMSDAVSELFDVEQILVDPTKEERLMSREEWEAQKKAEEEAARKAAEEEAARLAAEEEARKNAIMVSANGYMSKPGKGFNVTTGNKTYSLTDEEFNIVAGVVACEAGGSKDDALAVISVILNRADSSRYPNNPVGVVAAPGQFSCYSMRKDPSRYADVVRDALNGIRNNNYYGFRSWQTVSYSDNYIIERGNRYG